MPEDEGRDQGRELVELEIDTVGLVGKAANKRRFLLWKSQDKTKGGMEMPEEIRFDDLEQAQEIVAKAKIDEETRGILGAIVKFFKGQQQEPKPEPEPVVKEDPRVEELVKAQGAIRAELEKARERIEQAEAAFADEQNKRHLAEYVAKASALALPIDVEKTAELMQYLAKTDPEQSGVLENILQSASQAMITSGVFVEKGTSRAPETASPFEDQVQVKKAALMAQDPGLSENDAYVAAYRAVRRDNAGLAQQHLAKRQKETGRK